MLNEGAVLQNRYRILRRLSNKGGMGIVYQAEDQRLGSTVVVKETRYLQLDPEVREIVLKAFFREARLLANLRHATLPRVTDYFIEGDGHFLVMEFIPGKDLEELLTAPGAAFSVDEVLRWADRLLEVLEYLHGHKEPIIHRDIKPANLKLTPRGEVMLLDFGLAKGAAVGLQAASSVFGYTKEYAPLEQIEGKGTDARSDIFSLAATLYHLLTGRAPDNALKRVSEVAKNKPDPLPPLTALNPSVPAHVAAVITQAMALSPEDRPATAAEMRQALSARPAALRSFSYETVTLDAQGREQSRRTLQAEYFAEDLGDGVTLEMVRIPGGEFAMGSSEQEMQEALADFKRYDFTRFDLSEIFGGPKTEATLDIFKGEAPKHRVRVTEFFIGRFAVTREQWRQVARWPEVKLDLNEDPSNCKDWWRQPVELVTWEEAVEFCARLQKKLGKVYRLPSAAEWEYACRAGTTTPFAFGQTITPQIVNYNGNHPYGNAPQGEYRGKTIAVGSLGIANAFGLFDMHGNVYELCEDVWHDNYNGAPTDGSAWLSGGDSNQRVRRGGSWGCRGGDCRAAKQDWQYYARVSDNLVGFRVAIAAR